jgi:PTH1 family peptidyl-tRNA hydrolase
VAADLLVVGLGNPGTEFDKTRHNVGAEVVALLASRHGAKLKKSRRDRALVADARVGGRRIELAVPLTYMNDSGMAVAPLARRLEVEPEQIVIVHDELDLPHAALRVKAGGGLAGHNGLRSIKQHLHSDAFLRVRIGIGKPQSKEYGADHVLSRVSKRDREALAVTIEEAADAVETILHDGVDAAMNRYNTRT